jgi:hypothetical protein
VKILGLDIATHTGWADMDTIKHTVWTGTYGLASDKEVRQWRQMNLDRRCDPRIPRLFDWLKRCYSEVDIVIFEDVEFCHTSLQCQLWSALRSAIWCAFPAEKIECVPVGLLKKFATGNSKAQKEDMAAALMKKFPDRFGVDNKLPKGHLLYDHVAAAWERGDFVMTSDAVDAFWLAQWAKENVKR